MLKRYGKKEFLNLDSFHTVAAIATKFTVEGKAINGEISISDCNRTIYLECSVYPSWDEDKIDVDEARLLFNNAVHKAETLAKIASEFVTNLKSIEKEYFEFLEEYKRKDNEDERI